MELFQNYIFEIGALVLTAVLGYVSIKYKVKYTEVKDFLSYFLASLDDGKLTPDEVQGLVERGKKLIGME